MILEVLEDPMKKALCIMLVMVASKSFATEILGIPRVVDGDTLEIAGTKIRLEGIDAPEKSQKCLDAAKVSYDCGRRATSALVDRIGGEPVTCRISSIDRYGRSIGTCTQNRVDLNQWMVREGWAVAYRKYAATYVFDENTARLSKKNLWAGTFEMPWDFRSK
jgi:endonuclease YncB( thermonuclease family)